MAHESEPQLKDLRKKMGELFNEDELKEIVFDLGFDYENLAGDTKTKIIISLLKKSIRHGKYPKLISLLDEERSHFDWSSVSPDDPKIEDIEGELITTDERAEIFQEYVKKIENLIINHSLGNSTSNSIKELARTYTLTTLERLDALGKSNVLEFLMSQRLINRTNVVVNLKDADLQGANLHRVNLENANLAESDLRGADLSEAILDSAVLRGAILSDANLTKASLRGARKMIVNNEWFYFDRTDLSGVDLSRANLKDAKVYDWQLHKAASLNGATMPDGQIYRMSNEEDNSE